MEEISSAVISSLIIDLFELINEDNNLNTNNNNQNEDRSTAKLIELLRASLSSLDNNNNNNDNTEDIYSESPENGSTNELGYTDIDEEEAMWYDDVHYYSYSNILINRTLDEDEYRKVISRIVFGLPLTNFRQLSDIIIDYVRELPHKYLIKIEIESTNTPNYFFVDKDYLMEINEEESRTQEELNDIIATQFRNNHNDDYNDDDYEDDNYEDYEDEDYEDNNYNYDQIARIISEDELNNIIPSIHFTDRSNLSVPITMSSEEEEE